jgi:glycosyltransferase involved in cell wall biosynthesis
MERELAKRFEIRRNTPGEVNVYHLGNNALHRPVYDAFLARPGIAVVHDAVLHHFFLGFHDRRGYVEEFVHNYGIWAEAEAEALWERRASSSSDPGYFGYGLLRRPCETASQVLVHNPAAARRVRQEAPAARITEVPHYFTLEETPSERQIHDWRARQGLGRADCLFGVFGYLRESKRLASVLRAAEAAGARMLIQGEFGAPEYERSLDGMLADARVIRLPHLGEREFWLAAAATDVCVNLRAPAAGETSGITIRLMGLGRPVIVTAGEENSRYPEGSCFPVDAGPAEEEMLTEAMRWLRRDSPARAAMGRAAAEWIRREHSVEKAVESYARVITGTR